MTREELAMAIAVAPHAGSVDLKYAEAVKRPSQGMYRDGRWCIFGVIPYLTAISVSCAIEYSKNAVKSHSDCKSN